MKTKNYFSTLLLTAMFFVPFTTSAQVTIGSGRAPSQWSLLDLCTEYQQKALHNARMNTEQRDNLMSPQHPCADARRDARGLMIFNTNYDRNCLEFWNGKQWISLCGDRPDNGNGNNGGGGLPTEDTNARITTFVNVMYDFQRQQLEAWHTSYSTFDYVQWLVSEDGENFTAIPSAPNDRFFEIPVDFVHNNYPFADGENSKELYFRAILVTDTGDRLLTIPLNILFNRTTVSGEQNRVFLPGFGICDEGVRYITMGRAVEASYQVTPTANTIRLALLNVGASGTGSWGVVNGVRTHLSEDESRLNDAGDLGDFFQWGRVADGHQYVVWTKNPTTRENMFGPGTSGFVQRNRNNMVVNSYGQVTTSGFAGYFITTTNVLANSLDGADDRDWGLPPINPDSPETNTSCRIDLWGNTHSLRPSEPHHLEYSGDPTRSWTPRARNNNPCPPGWRVPSRFEWFDMHNGDGTDISNTYTGWDFVGEHSGNKWIRRDVQPYTNAYGGAVVTNRYGKSVFLPATGVRGSISGALSDGGTAGGFWTSSNQPVGNRAALVNRMNNAGILFFWPETIQSRATSSPRSTGRSVRCVK